ncbi:ATP-binding cassette domain-containing protein [Carnobacterium gallinarum]|uniref:ATP-binding cassette domain-containing protein n=1 Tax=Carnobacterium gallinarum TaxID=2749 RepID=UPI00054D392C|nr:ATP-binding cassette domain-containing protein [Carnobacterium gallinarum]
MNLLTVSHLSKKYQEDIFQDISFELTEGQILGILGRNGIGKTTFLECLTGYCSIDEGKIQLNNCSQKNSEFREQTSYISTDHLFEGYQTIHAILQEYRLLFPKFQPKEALRMMLDWDVSPNKKWMELSKGSKDKVKIACELAKETPLIVLDEPFSALDYVARNQLKKMLLQQSGENKIIILSTNFIEGMDNLFTDILVLNRAKKATVYHLETEREEYGHSLRTIYEEEAYVTTN